jgi:hypothetical protein
MGRAYLDPQQRRARTPGRVRAEKPCARARVGAALSARACWQHHQAHSPHGFRSKLQPQLRLNFFTLQRNQRKPCYSCLLTRMAAKFRPTSRERLLSPHRGPFPQKAENQCGTPRSHRWTVWPQGRALVRLLETVCCRRTHCKCPLHAPILRHLNPTCCSPVLVVNDSAICAC